MFTATRTGRTGSAIPDAPAVLEVGMDRLVERHGLPLVVLDIGRAARQYRAVRSAFPSVDVHYDVSALSHPALISAMAADGGSFAISHDGALETLTNVADLSRVLHATPVVHPHEVLAAYNAGVRRFIVDGPADVEKFVGYPNDLCLLVRLRPDDPRRGHAMPRGIRAADAARVVRFAASLGVRIAGFSLSLPPTASPQYYVSRLASTAGLMADVEATTGLRLDAIDLGDAFPGSAAERTTDRAELHRAIRAILAPASARMSVTASASRAVTAGCITVVAGTVEHDVDPLVASECIDDGAGVAVIGAAESDIGGGSPDTNPALAPFFRAIVHTGHRMLRTGRREPQTWSSAG
jgi:diaminopimelate decarboxylase